ncbi:MAG: TlpA disulfide reductase family protein [Deltaproteobacteria bacterium]|nr:TlpA disulfide reductase family protein [Deltaproteobacteria bacterium]
MQRILSILAILALGMAFVFFYEPPSKVRVNEMAVPFTLPNEQGEQISLHAFKGKVVLLNFWATWCPPCRAEIPAFVKLKKEFEGKNLQLLLINRDSSHFEESVQAVAAFRRVVPFDIPVLYDVKDVADLYGVYSLPKTFIISPDGVILAVIDGYSDWTSPEYLSIIDATLKNP